MNPVDELRGAYNQFLKSPTGRDLLTRLMAYEVQMQTENYRDDTTSEKKLANINKMAGIYWVRTLLDDLSKPKPTPSVSRKRTRPDSQ